MRHATLPTDELAIFKLVLTSFSYLWASLRVFSFPKRLPSPDSSSCLVSALVFAFACLTALLGAGRSAEASRPIRERSG